jgi:hypothetical protein
MVMMDFVELKSNPRILALAENPVGGKALLVQRGAVA